MQSGAGDNSVALHIKRRLVKKQSTPYLTGVNLMAIGRSGLLTLSERLRVSHSPARSNWNSARPTVDELSTSTETAGWVQHTSFSRSLNRWRSADNGGPRSMKLLFLQLSDLTRWFENNSGSSQSSPTHLICHSQNNNSIYKTCDWVKYCCRVKMDKLLSLW